jgi:N6-L-threonylcarbamoyladenine synthase
MDILGIETSCDETSVAIVRDGREILFHRVFSQTEIHKPFDGVVPELSARAHLEHLNPMLEEAVTVTGLTLQRIDCFAVTNRPGLAGSLITGVTVAKTLSWVFQKPIIGVNHLLAHLYACFLAGNGTDAPPEFPFIGLVVSGGHTLLLTVRSWDDVTVEGSTIDDAAGEAFDKASRILGLGYPGGPEIDRLAEQGDPSLVRFPEITMYNKKKDNSDFSYSGLKTALLFHMKKHPETRIADAAAAFRQAAVSVLRKKAVRLAAKRGIPRIVVAGGVAANSLLRRIFTEPGHEQVFLAPRALCGDNAAMVAGLAHHTASAGRFDTPDLNAYARNDITQGAIR